MTYRMKQHAARLVLALACTLILMIVGGAVPAGEKPSTLIARTK